MLHGMLRATGAALVLLLAGTARAGDCYNDDNEILNDLEPAVLRVSDADVARMLAEIAAGEQRRLVERRARESARAAAPGSKGG